MLARPGSFDGPETSAFGSRSTGQTSDTTGRSTGSRIPLNQRVEFEGYFDYQHDTGGDHNRKVYAIGTVLNLYF